MKIARLREENGHITYALADGDGGYQRIAGDPFGDIEVAGDMVTGKLLAPISPVNILAIGLNYRAHIKEGGFELPEHPVVFMKPTSSVIGPDAAVCLPKACEHGPEVDYEAELAVVIGEAARDVPAINAMRHVFGYTCCNDISARRWQKHGGGGQWVRGKSFDTFCPLGPVLVTADELDNAQELAIRTELNGEVMQDGNTSDMIFSIADLIAFLSRDTTLLPGTVILTGTPPGVGFARNPPVFLSAGDEVNVTIDGIGTLSNRVA